MDARNGVYPSANSLAAILTLAILASGIGCGGGGEGAGTEAGQADQASTNVTSKAEEPTLRSHVGEPPLSESIAASRKSVQIPPANANAKEVVYAFLEATRGGDDDTASALLTRKAIEETTRRGLSVQPPGSASMHYTIGRAEPAPNDGMYVKSVWSEQFDDGSTEEYEVVWILRQEDRGWRIAGMAAQLDADADPLFIDFEFPEELAKRVNAGEPEEGIVNAPYEPPVEQARRSEPGRSGGDSITHGEGRYSPPNGYQPPAGANNNPPGRRRP